MPLIGSRTFGDGVKKYISLASEEFIRPLGGPWNTVAIGILCAITPDGTNNTAATKLSIGICSGTTNGVGTGNGAGTCTNFVGAQSQAAFVYTANSGNPYYSQAQWYGMTRVGTTDVTVTTATTVINIASNTGAIQRRSLLVVRLTRSGANILIDSVSNATTQFTTDWTYTDILDSIQASVMTPVRGSTALLTTGQKSIASSDVAGTLNSLNIWWPNATFPLEIYSIEIMRFS